MWVDSRNFERQFYDFTCNNSPRFIKKSLFDEIGGYDEKYTTGDDIDYTYNAVNHGWDICILDYFVQHHQRRESKPNLFYKGNEELVEKKVKENGYYFKSKWGLK